MKIRAELTMLFILTLAGVVWVAPSLAQNLEPVDYVRTLDGDSIIVRSDGKNLNIRLLGIDAPEKHQEYSKRSRSYVHEFCSNGRLSLEFDKEKHDRYGRTLAYVWKDGRMLNQELVFKGLAIAVYYRPNGKYRIWLEHLQNISKIMRFGFWSEGGLKQSPAQFRKKNGTSHQKK